MRALGCPTRWSLPGAAQFSFTPLSPAMASARTRKSKNRQGSQAQNQQFAYSRMVLRIFFKILVMRANFGDFGILVSTSKFWKKFVTFVTPYWDKFWKVLTFEFWWNSKVMTNHRGGILIFCQILSKMKILDFRVKDSKFCDFVKFWILGLRISNFQFSSIFSSNLFKIHEKIAFFLPKSKFCVLGLRIRNFDFR